MITAPATLPASVRAHPPLAAPVDLNGRGHYLHWGFVQVSAANLVMIGLIALVLAAAVLLPFPKPKGGADR